MLYQDHTIRLQPLMRPHERTEERGHTHAPRVAALLGLSACALFLASGAMALYYHLTTDTTTAPRPATVTHTANTPAVATAAAILDDMPDTFEATLVELTPTYAVLHYREAHTVDVVDTNTHSNGTLMRSAYIVTYRTATTEITGDVALNTTVRATIEHEAGDASAEPVDMLVRLTAVPTS